MKNKLLFIIATIIFLLDRTSKIAVVSNLSDGTVLQVIDGFLSFIYLQNTGAAFSLLQEKQILLITVSMFIIIFIVSFFSRRSIKDTMPKIAWGLVLGGALGNLFDRMNYNYVIDFINLDFTNFAVFNIADVAISVGVVLVCYYILFKEGKDA